MSDVSDRGTADLSRWVIATPCTRDWDEMSGDDRQRLCRHCNKHVYHLANLSHAEIVDLMNSHGDPICARLFRRSDGTIVTSECPSSEPNPAPQRARLQFSIAHVLFLMIISASVFASFPWMAWRLEQTVNRWFPASTSRQPPAPTFLMGAVLEVPIDPIE